MADKKNTPKAEDVITLGPLTVARSVLASLESTGPNKSGIVLANDRIKLMVPVGPDGRLVEFSLSCYIQRESITQAEHDAVAKMAAEKKQTAAEKKQEDQDRLAREKQAAYEYGKTAMLDAFKNISHLQAAANALASAVK